MKKPTVLFFLILTLAFLASILIFWRLFIRQPSPIEPVPGPTPVPPTPFIQPTPTVEIFKEGKGESAEEILDSLKKKFPLVEFLPYETDDFSVDYIAPLHLRVKIRNATFSAKISQEVSNWIKSKGIDPTTHKIDWITPEP